MRTRTGSLLLILTLLTACASTPPPPLAPSLRETLGRVYLVSSDNKPQTFVEADVDTGGVAGAFKGAGRGAGNALDQCLSSAIGSMQLAPVILAVCSVLVVPTSIVNGSVAGGRGSDSAQAQVAMKDRVNEALHQADFSLALTNMIDEEGQRNSALAPYDLAHGILPPLAQQQSAYAQAREWDYQTVMEIEVLEAGLEEYGGKVPMLQWKMTVQVTLVDTATGRVRAVQEYQHSSSPQPVQYWLEEDYATLSRAIVEANKTLTGQIVGNVFIN